MHAMAMHYECVNLLELNWQKSLYEVFNIAFFMNNKHWIWIIFHHFWRNFANKNIIYFHFQLTNEIFTVYVYIQSILFNVFTFMQRYNTFCDKTFVLYITFRTHIHIYKKKHIFIYPLEFGFWMMHSKNPLL